MRTLLPHLCTPSPHFPHLQVKLFVAGLTKASSNRGSAIFTTAELERFARDMRLSVPSFVDFLEVLNQQSYLLKRGPGEWKLTTSGAS